MGDEDQAWVHNGAMTISSPCLVSTSLPHPGLVFFLSISLVLVMIQNRLKSVRAWLATRSGGRSPAGERLPGCSWFPRLTPGYGRPLGTGHSGIQPEVSLSRPHCHTAWPYCQAVACWCLRVDLSCITTPGLHLRGQIAAPCYLKCNEGRKEVL